MEITCHFFTGRMDDRVDRVSGHTAWASFACGSHEDIARPLDKGRCEPLSTGVTLNMRVATEESPAED